MLILLCYLKKHYSINAEIANKDMLVADIA